MVFVVGMLFLVGTASAFEFDNKLTYEKEDMKVNFDNLFGLGKHFGEIELKSHSSVIEIKKVGFGKEEVVMYYDFTNWELYENGLGEVIFIDMRTGKEIDKDYYFVEWKEVDFEVRDYEEVCSLNKINNSEECYNKVLGTHLEKRFDWVKYDSRDIPEGNSRIGLKTYVGQEDWIDGVWTIVGKEVSKHITWTGDLNTDLGAYWKLDESSGNALDSVNSNDGVITGATQGADGKIGTAYFFSVSNEYVAIPDSADVSMTAGNDQISMSAWFKTSSATSQMMIVKEGEYSLSVSNGGIVMGIFGANSGTLGSGYDDGDWHYVVAIFDEVNDELVIYVDDTELIGSPHSTSVTSGDTDAEFLIGIQNRVSANFTGSLDEVGLWQRRLSADEIEFLYNDGDGLTYGDDGIDALVVTLETPANYTNFTATNEVDFECFAYDYVNDIVNVSLYIDGVLNETDTEAYNDSSSHFEDKILSEGHHDWTCEVYSNISESFTAEEFILNVNTTPDIYFNEGVPVNEYNSTIDNFEVNVSLTETFFKNITFDLYNVNGALNQTETFTDATRSKNWTDLPDAKYSYNVTVWTTTNQFNQTETRNISIDINEPFINLTNPEEDQYVIGYTDPFNVSINWTVSDLNIDSCWINNGTENISVDCSSNYTGLNFSSGNQTIIFYANDTLGNENSTELNFFVNYVVEDTTFEDPVIEGNPTNIYLNISATEINSFNGTLYWNNTAYTASSDYDLTNGVLNTTLIVPLVLVNTNVNISWIYNLNGVEYNSSVYNHTIYFLTSINITNLDCSDKALRFDIQDEENLTALYGDIEYNFQYGLTNNSLKTVYGSLTNVTTFYVCINASISENYTLGYGEIQYRSNDHVDRRYYLFENKILSNNTLANHTLRDLLTADQTSFLMSFEDTSLNIYEDKYIALWRWYPDLNAYQIVEMGKTDEQGETVSHINTEDTDYRVGIYEKDGTLLKLGNPLRFICASAPCTFVLRVGEGDLDFSTFFDVETSLTYNETTKLFTLIYNDPNQLTSEMQLLVTRETGTSTLIICNETSSEFTGVMTCNTSAYSGIKKALVYRSASPEIPIDQLIVSAVNNVFKSGFGLFISIFLWLAIVLTGLGNNPLWTIILMIVGLIPALLLGSINVAIFTGVAVLGAIVIHFIKRSLT